MFSLFLDCEEKNNTHSKHGTPLSSVFSSEECITRCLENPRCVAADYDFTKTIAGCRCFLHTESKKQYHKQGVAQYIMKRCPNGKREREEGILWYF